MVSTAPAQVLRDELGGGLWRAGGMLAATLPVLNWLLIIVRAGSQEVGSFPYVLTLGLTRVTQALKCWVVHNDSLMLIPCASTLLVIAVDHNPPAVSLY